MIGAATVAVGWSGYFVYFFQGETQILYTLIGPTMSIFSLKLL